MSKRMQRLVVIVAAIALIVPVGVIGFSSIDKGDDQPDASSTSDRPTVDPDSQPSPSPTTAAQPSADMSQDTEQGAEATLVYLLQSFGYMMATGDTTAWSSYSAETCTGCANLIQQAAALSSAGGYQSGGEIAVADVASEKQSDGSVHVEVRMAQNGGALVDDPTLQAQTFAQTAGIVTAELTWDDGQWVVTSMTMQEDSAGSDASE